MNTPKFPSDIDFPDRLDWTALARYVSGQSDRAERALIDEWIKAHPSHEEFVAQLERVWQLAAKTSQRSRTPSVNEAVASIFARIEVSAQADTEPSLLHELRRPSPQGRRISKALSRRSFGGSMWLSGGAVALAAASITAVVLWQSKPAPRPNSMPAMQAFATTPGQRATIELADGSRVQLGVDSRMTVVLPDSGAREITLEGEAIFDVAHDSTRAFIVRARDVVTRDIGTIFGIRAYAEDSVVRVAVSHGEVAVRSERIPRQAETTLKRGQVGHVNRVGGVRVRSNVDVEQYFAWTAGVQSFDDVPLREVGRELERWYGATIELGLDTGERRLTAEFRNEPLPSAMRRIAQALDLKVIGAGNHFKLTIPDTGAAKASARDQR